MSSVAVVFSLEVLMDRHARGCVPCHPSATASIILNPNTRPKELQGSSAPLGNVHPTHLAHCRSHHALGGCWEWIWELGTGSGMGHERSCTHHNAPTPGGRLLSQKTGVYPNHSSQGCSPTNPTPSALQDSSPAWSSPVVGPDGVQDELHPVLLTDALLVVLDHAGQVLDVTCREKV